MLLDPWDDCGIRISWLSYTMLHSTVTVGAGCPYSDQRLPLLPERTRANEHVASLLLPPWEVYGVCQPVACESPSARSAQETGLTMTCMPPWCG